MINTAPTLIGTRVDQGTGIAASAQNTQIVPYLLGTVTATSGGLGTSGAANTFVTYSASGGLRPLNLTDEFTQNAFTAVTISASPQRARSAPRWRSTR